MATAPLSWKAFGLKRNTSNDAQQSNPDPFGFFYCRLSTARFLEIQDLGQNLIFKKERRAHTRSRSIADGTTLGAAASASTDINVAAAPITINPKNKPAGKNYKLITGKRVGGLATKGYATLSFNFPSWATSVVVSDSLGSIIPANKMASSPGVNQIRPIAISPGGKGIPIMARTAADTSTDATPILNLGDAQENGLIAVEGAD